MLQQSAHSLKLVRRVRRVIAAWAVVLLAAAGALVAVDRATGSLSSQPPVLAHYMPWFETPDTLGAGRWGWHWTMDTRDPAVRRPDGRRSIASHFDPVIGPYDSSDTAVLRYHLLLMKYSGIGGVLIDWYGTQGRNADVVMLQRNTQALIEQATVVGLRYAVVYEDRFARGPADVQASLAFARAHWFDRPGYLRLASTRRPYLGVFGPISVRDSAVWQRIVGGLGPVDVRTLWNNDRAGAAADGQFAWPYEARGGPGWQQRLQAFYGVSSFAQRRVTAVAFPGFDDYYARGLRNGTSLFVIPYDDGATLRRTLDLAAGGGTIDSIQLATWNDFGEGTMVEPTVQRGFASLVAVQRFTGVRWNEGDLRLVLDWYRTSVRRTAASDAAAAAFQDLVRGDVARARATLNVRA